MASEPDHAKSIFLNALELPSGDARQVYLDRMCGPDASLRAEVDELLRHHAELPPACAASAIVRTVDMPVEAPVAGKSGAAIGPYKLLQQIGEGGMGTVFMAEQTEPVQRKVALKLIKPGMDSRQVISRFEAERQALALMDHPHIAKVLDAGTTEAGLPYFVMELVKGTPITKYCDEHRLSPRERLELFIPVCQAVQHAHQKGIIHRDLKPSNVLVALYDGRPVPKVIDFGVAKATGRKLTERTMYTEFGAIVGTLEYMSPEQAELNQLDIDTRSDIYSLGVLLYELLTGTTPFEKKRLKDAALMEILRVIREDEPQKPSTRLSTTDELPSISANRGLEPNKLSALVRGELDWIVMKALEKDRNRRYETASGFALDIQRYLADEPVAACPPSAVYRLRKFARRNKTAFALGATVTAALVVAIVALVVSNILVRSESHQKEIALEGKGQALIEKVQALKAAEKAAEAEKAANAQARKRLAQIEKANDLLGSIFENLDPHEIAMAERPLQAILVEKLDRAVAELEGEAIGDPLVVATLQQKFGTSLDRLGEPEKAIVLLEKARATRQARLGRDDPDTLLSMHNLACAYQNAGKLELALPLCEETLQLRKARLGLEHPYTLSSMDNLALVYRDAGKLDLALPLFEETLQLCKSNLGLEHPYTHTTMNNLALAYQDVGKLDLALPLLEETVQLSNATRGPEHPATLTKVNNLALAYQAAGKLDLARRLFEKTLQLRTTRQGPEHPFTLKCIINLAKVYQDVGKPELALPLFEESARVLKAKLGPGHRDTLMSMDNLAAAYRDVGKLELALPLCEETLELCRSSLGPGHPQTLSSMNNLALACQSAGKLDRALPLLEEAVLLSKAHLGLEHPYTLMSMNNLGLAYQDAGKLDLSLPFCEETLRSSKAKLGPEHPHTVAAMNNLARAYRLAGKLDLALPLYEESLRLSKARLGSEHRETLTSMNNLAVAYQDARKLELAVPLFEEALRLSKARLGPEHFQTLTIMNNLARAYLYSRQVDLAVPLFEETFRLRKDRLGPEHPDTLTSMGNLAVAYQHAGKLDLALPLLEESLQLKNAQLGRDHPDTLTSVNNLAIVYQNAGKLDMAVPLFEETLRLRKARLGSEHPETLSAMFSLAGAYRAAGKLDPALALFEERLRLLKAKIGPDEAITLSDMNGLAYRYLEAGKLESALPLFKETLELRKAKLGPEHPDTLVSMTNLGSAYQADGKLDLAVLLFKQALELRKAKLGPEHPDTLGSLTDLASAYQAAGKLDLALPLFKETLELRKANLGPAHPDTLLSMYNLGLAYQAAGKQDLVWPLYEEMFQIEKARQLADHPDGLSRRKVSAPLQSVIGALRAHRGEWNEAVAAFDGALELDSTNQENWYCAATLHAVLRDRDGFCRACREILNRFAGTDNAQMAERAAKACLLLPEALSAAEFDRVQTLARRAVTGTEQSGKSEFFTVAKGLAEYRAGQCEEAIKWFERSTPNPDGTHRDAMKFALVAMAHRGLGQTQEARASLSKAQSIMTQKSPDPSRGVLVGRDWLDWAEAQIFLREAEELLAKE